MLKIELSWPAQVLHPNRGRGRHWSTRHRAAKVARKEAAILARVSEGRNLFIHDGQSDIPVQLIFHPPTRRNRDEDNLVAACKALLDGVADGLMVDDKCFRLARPRVLEPVKGGKVVVEITT